MDWLCDHRAPSLASKKGWRVHSLIRRRLYVNYYGLQFKFTRQVVLVIVGCGVAISNDACVRGIRGYSRPTALI